ncbi:IS110 family transposase [bacterium]|nr:IS110 family transposase [bacterium]MBU4362335.1 IS110 family transposase [bacterium]MBU4602404.1 IS110 family transposase [bacterium]
MYYIGIDVSKKDLSVFDGKKDLKFINKEGLKSFKKYLKKKVDFSDLVIIFEPTGVYSLYLKEFCAENNIKAYIVNPKKSHNFTRALGKRSKTDKIDARILYQFHKLIDLKDIKIPKIDQQAKALASYLTSYEFALKQRVSLSNHLESLRDKGLIALMKKDLKRAKKLEDKIFNDILEYVSKNQNLKEDYQRLLTISGVGDKTAIALLTLFKTYQGTNRAQITALAGLDPVRRESGTSVKGKVKISKNGKGIYRKILYLPTICATVHNQKIRVFYQRLLAHHKIKKLAVIASMRKILLIAHAMYRDKTEYVAA